MRRRDLKEGEIYVMRNGRHVGLVKKGLIYHLVSANNNEYDFKYFAPTSEFFCEAGEYYNRLRGVYGNETD